MKPQNNRKKEPVPGFCTICDMQLNNRDEYCDMHYDLATAGRLVDKSTGLKLEPPAKPILREVN